MAKKATTEPIEATDETSVGEMTLEQLQAKIAELQRFNREREAELVEMNHAIQEKDAKIEQLEGRDEGWLIKTPNPTINEKGAYGIMFTDGLAFLQKDRKFDAPIETAEKMATVLHSDFGYEVQYFKKEDWDKLDDIKIARARERQVTEEKLKSHGQWMENLLKEHSF